MVKWYNHVLLRTTEFSNISESLGGILTIREVGTEIINGRFSAKGFFVVTRVWFFF